MQINNYLCFIAIAITFPAKSAISIFGPMEILASFFCSKKKYISNTSDILFYGLPVSC